MKREQDSCDKIFTLVEWVAKLMRNKDKKTKSIMQKILRVR